MNRLNEWFDLGLNNENDINDSALQYIKYKLLNEFMHQDDFLKIKKFIDYSERKIIKTDINQLNTIEDVDRLISLADVKNIEKELSKDVIIDFKNEDWLVDGKLRPAQIIKTSPTEIQLQNGLVQRTFFLSPSPACYDFKNLMTGEQLLRSITPEARITINGKLYELGAKSDATEKGYFRKEWLSAVKTPTHNFQFQDYSISEITPHFQSKVQ
jgi:hypothetical protein